MPPIELYHIKTVLGLFGHVYTFTIAFELYKYPQRVILIDDDILGKNRVYSHVGLPINEFATAVILE